MLNGDTVERLRAEETSIDNGSVSQMPKKKKWGKIGAPKSAKRRAWMKKIRKKRTGVKRVKPKFPKRKTRRRKTR